MQNPPPRKDVVDLRKSFYAKILYSLVSNGLPVLGLFKYIKFKSISPGRFNTFSTVTLLSLLKIKQNFVW